MADEKKKEAEEVTATRVSGETGLDKRPTDSLAEIRNTATLPDNPEALLTEVSKRMRRVAALPGLDRAEKLAARRELSQLLLNAHTEKIAADTRYIQRLVKFEENVRKVRVLNRWLDFITKEGAAFVVNLNEFLDRWLAYCQETEEKAHSSPLTPERKQVKLDRILRGENSMIQGIDDMLSTFGRQTDEQKKKAEEDLK